MANDRIYAHCTAVGCRWRVMLYKYYPGIGLTAREDIQAVADEMADHWDGHERVEEFDLGLDPGFFLATQMGVDKAEWGE